MGRQYLNDRWCARCDHKKATPYLRQYAKLFPPAPAKVLDIGCGNGRNSRFMMDLGYDVDGIDMAPVDFGVKIVLGEDDLPNKKYDIILANFILMFLNKKELKKVNSEILRCSKKGTTMMIEMYPAKDAYVYDFDNIVKYYINKGWTKVRKSKDKCVLRREN